MRGMRWARNRVHHQWADALQVVGTDDAVMRRYPERSHEWLWRNAEELPRPPKRKQDPRGEAVYGQLLQGHTAEDTLGILGETFDDVWRLMVFPGSIGMPGMGFDPDDRYRDLCDPRTTA